MRKGQRIEELYGKKKIEHLFFNESFICTVPGSHSFYSQEAGEMCSPPNKLGRSHEREAQEIITTLSPFLASLVPSSVKVAFQIPKLCWDSEAGESQKSVWAIDPTRRMGEINITFGHKCIWVFVCGWSMHECMSTWACMKVRGRHWMLSFVTSSVFEAGLSH